MFWNKLRIIPMFLLLLFPLSCSSNHSKENKIFIKEVHDGDTFNFDGGRIRLFGVDTPELNIQSQNFKETIGIERFYGDQATYFAKEAIENSFIMTDEKTKDRYGRIVSKIKYGKNYEKDLGIQLISCGLARVAYIEMNPKSIYFSDDYDYYEKLLIAQHDAYVNNVGLWKQKEDFNVIFPKA